MPTNVNSVPATFVLATGTSSQGITFAIPAGFVCLSASLALAGTVVSTPAQVLFDFTWTVSGEVDNFAAPSIIGTAYSTSAACLSGAVSDINAAAGSNVSGTVNWQATGALSVTSFVLTLTGSVPSPTVFAQLGSNQVQETGIDPTIIVGVITNTTHSTVSLGFTATEATGGTSPFSHQWAYRLTGVGSYVNFGTNSLSSLLSGLTPATGYDIRLRYTDADSNSADAFLLNVMTDAAPIGGTNNQVTVIPAGMQSTGNVVNVSLPM